MPLATSTVRTLCRKRIANTSFTPSDPIRFEQLIVHSVERSLTNGRFQRWNANRSRAQRLTVRAYVDRVIEQAHEEFERVIALEEKDSAAWTQLQTLLTHRAAAIIRQSRPTADIFADAAEFAQQACLVIYHTTYPCDVAFDAWATIILKNIIFERYARSPDALDRNVHPDSLDAPVSHDETGLTLAELIPNSQLLAPFAQVEDRMVLLEAIDQLQSRAQRKVIIAAFLEEQDDAQIARRLHKTKQAVYNLRDRALAKLYEILIVE